MRRFEYSIKKHQRRSIDPNNPDTRPIALASASQRSYLPCKKTRSSIGRGPQQYLFKKPLPGLPDNYANFNPNAQYLPSTQFSTTTIQSPANTKIARSVPLNPLSPMNPPSNPSPSAQAGLLNNPINNRSTHPFNFNSQSSENSPFSLNNMRNTTRLTHSATIFTQYEPPDIPDAEEMQKYMKLGKCKISAFLKSAEKFDSEPAQQPISKKLEILNNENFTSSKEETRLMANNFIRNFIYNKTQDVQALIIQRAFRLYMKKRHWHRCLGIHVTYHQRLKRLMFLCWRLAHSNDPVVLRSLFNKFTEFYEFIKNRFKIREKAPFKLFYISGRIFLPDGYTADVVFNFIYLMSMPMLHRIFRLWVYTTRKRIHHRKSLVFIRQTSKKWTMYGKIYQFFQLWHRYTQYKKIERKSPLSKDLITIPFSEVSVLWNLLERRMNRRRSLMMNAIEHSHNQIKVRAIKALFHNIIENKAEYQVIQQSDNFRNRNLQLLAHRAWLRYIQIRHHEQHMLRDSFKAWYQHVYDIAAQKFKFDMSVIQHDRMKLIKIMNNWYKITQQRKITNLQMSLRTQANPSMALVIIFLLKNEYELFFSTLVFRMWIRFVRARNRWKSFAKWSSKPDKEHELKQMILTEFRRVNTLKLLRRMFVNPGPFFPRKTFFSFELTYKEYLDGKRNDEKVAKNKKWSFLTSDDKNDPSKIDYNLEVLNRCFVLRLNQIKHYDSGNSIDQQRSKETQNERNPFFEKCRTFEELYTGLKTNTELLRDRLVTKISRDNAILTGMVTHISALYTQKHIKNFTTQDSFSFVKIKAHIPTNSNQNVIVYADLNESIEDLFNKLNNSQPKIPYDFEGLKNQMILDFSRRLRDPKDINKPQGLKLFGQAMTGLASSVLKKPLEDVQKNPLISSHVNFPNQDAEPQSIFAQLRTSKINQSCEHLSDRYFTVSNLQDVLNSHHEYETIISSLLKFFTEITRVSLDISTTLSISRPNDIAPNVDQSKRHKMVNNIAAFLAQIAGFSDLSKVPRRVNAPDYATAAVDAILTMHHSLMMTSLSQYCDETPFSTKILFNDHLVSESYSSLWMCLKKRYKKIELPISFIGMMRQFGALAMAARENPSSSHSNRSASGVSGRDDQMTSKEAIIGCYLLPFIISYDLLKEFSKDEITGKS
ncbi:hypothetical protein TRFO_25100 [Tritrichomonas foetus]|uniref:IQ calmodulin-binding motif family protein n=1 Tax=Tritrichomonas foetus TaxID=1144522 RepID=A0A1J4K7I6_9EUKA|nr:hypothetical protein TRFO_25100 [Tritrichomonas foetus]|eukprot:OHT06848.1 hypothetical protein TRFO_25100 [Tritrichomonas foetus]